MNSTQTRSLTCPLWLYNLLPFLRWWPMVNRGTLRADLIAGLTGSLIVLPQGVAFATIAGLPPEYGLYAAMVPTVIAALFGSSWHLVSGPTTAISIAVFASVSTFAKPGTEQFIGLVLTLTFMTGVFQLVMGLARMGTLVNFISHTVVIGFTAGAAVLIAASQVPSFFGIPIPRGTPFYEILHQLVVQFTHINLYVTGIALLTLVSGVLARRYIPKLPYMIVSMVVASLVAFVLNYYVGEATTGITTVGALGSGLPPFSMPDFSILALKQTFFPALVITILALTEAVSISRAIAVKSEQRIDGNLEFVGQGLSNMFGSFFSSYASSGSFNRSGVNYSGGARTPLAAVFSAVFLVVIVLLVAQLAAYLPTAAMAGILFLVAWSLIDFHHIQSIRKASRKETVVLIVTFVGTLVDLEKGIFFGIILSLAFYLYRTSRPSIRAMAPDPTDTRHRFIPLHNGMQECPQLKILRFDGSIFFGAVDHVQRTLHQVDEANPQQKHVFVHASGMNFVDLPGGEMLAQESKRRKRLGGGLYFQGVKEGVCNMIRKGGHIDEIGRENIFASKTEAIATIFPKLNPEVCRTCTARIFRECGEMPPQDE